MKTSKYNLFTSFNVLKDKGNVFNLMFRGGIVRQLSSGIYTWLPNGLRVINNLIKIIREEFDNLGFVELLMPIIQPSKIWIDSKRFNKYGKELFKLYDRNHKSLILAPTHEEVITKLVCDENFAKLPRGFYQIQNKFRDEIRPCLGTIRSKEFIMQDAYSFHTNVKDLNSVYSLIIKSYKNIFNKIGLNIYIKKASCGNIGGNQSHEFYTISSNGEHNITLIKNKIFYPYSLCFKDINKIFTNLEDNVFLKRKSKYFLFSIKNIDNFVDLKNKINICYFIKTLLIKIYFNDKIKKLFVLIPFYKELDLIKLSRIYIISNKIELFNDIEILKYFKCKPMFLGPFIFKYKVIADYSLINYTNFIIGSCKNNFFYFDVNWSDQLVKVYKFYDICKYVFVNSDLKEFSISTNKKVSVVEVAHVFKLMDKYSRIFNLSNNNILKKSNIFMGCYGIGVTRLISVIVDNYHDDKGIIWPLTISNFKLGIIPVNMYSKIKVYNFSYFIYNYLVANKIEVLLDDRKLYIGKMLTDFELIGIPYFLIISYSLLVKEVLEFRDRINKKITYIPKKFILNFLYKLLK